MFEISPFETFTRGGSVPLLQARRKPKGFPGADLQTVSTGWKDAAPRMNVSEAQLVTIVKSSCKEGDMNDMYTKEAMYWR